MEAMKNVIFDFGNVLVRWVPEKIYGEYFGSEAKAWWFLRHVADAEWRTRMDAGELTKDCVEDLTRRFPEYGEAIQLFDSRYYDMLTGEMPGMRQVISELKDKGVGVYGLTNWSMETFPEARRRMSILQMIDHYVVSAAERLVKPDRRLFQVLLGRYKLKAEDCIFVDDNEANVKAACDMGMEGILFRGADDLRRRIGLRYHPNDEEKALLLQQGNWCDNWSRFYIHADTDLSCLRNNHFGVDVELGDVETVSGSNIQNCMISDGCRVEEVRLLSGYWVERNCKLFNIGEMSYSPNAYIDVMNENGGRRIYPHRDMTVADAYLFARFRDRDKVMEKLKRWACEADPAVPMGIVGEGSHVHNSFLLTDGIIGPHCEIGPGVIARRFLLGENVKLEDGLRLNDTVVGDNSTLARGEVGNSFIFPAHEQHHNSSFLIAALVQGQSNVASGATLGSNHNGRTPDGELAAGRGFWPGLCVSLKHFCRFASYTLIAKGDYPSELNITLPFALINNNVAKNRLEVMPAYWWMYNMYALNRNITKFAKRDRRTFRRQHIEFSPFAPDTAEEILVGRDLLRMWTAKAYQDGEKTEVVAYGMERGHRKTIILKPGDAYRAYEEMLIYYAMSELGTSRPAVGTPCGNRERRWVNMGGQLIPGSEMEHLLDDIENGKIDSWTDLNKRFDDLWACYPEQRAAHAYAVLCELAQKKTLDEKDWNYFARRYADICETVRMRIAESKKKDEDNEFRQTTFWNTAEMRAVMQ